MFYYLLSFPESPVPDSTLGDSLLSDGVTTVVDGMGYGIMPSSFGGTFTSASGTDFPAESDVRDGVNYALGAYSGNMTEPSESNVRDGVQYGAGGTEFTGNMTEPAEADVKDGVQYGANGTEFEGALVSGGGGAHGWSY